MTDNRGSQVPPEDMPEELRRAFLVRVYVRLLAAIVLLVAFEWFLFDAEMADLLGLGGPRDHYFDVPREWDALIVIFVPLLMMYAAFSVVYGHWPSRFAPAVGILLLVGYVLVLTPLLLRVEEQLPGFGMEMTWYLVAGLPLLALTAYRYYVLEEFLWYRGALRWCMFLGLFGALVGVTTGFRTVTGYALGAAAFVGATILHHTQEVMSEARDGEEMLAAVGLFASPIITLVWYLKPPEDDDEAQKAAAGD